MSVARARREAAKRLALAVQQRYRKLVESNGQGEDAIVIATADLATCMYENVEFIINVLRDYGGLQANFEPMTSSAPAPKAPANDLPPVPAIFTAGADVDLRKKN